MKKTTAQYADCEKRQGLIVGNLAANQPESQRELHILHLGKYFPPIRGGIEQVTYDLAQGLSHGGISTSVICFNDVARTTKENGFGYEVVRAATLAVVFSQPVSLSMLLELLRFKRRQKTPFLVHIQVPNPLAALWLLLLPKRPTIVVHWQSDIVRQKIGAAMISWLEQRLLAAADAVIVTSPPYKEHSAPLRRWHHKTHVIPLGIPDEFSAPCTVVPSAGTAVHTVLSVGRFVHYKGFSVLLEAIALLPAHYRLRIVGSGPLDRSLRKLARSLGIEDRVDFLGNVDRDLLLNEYRNCTLFCLPSITKAEAFGVVLLEAMSASKPLVTTLIPGSGTSWINTDGVTGYNVGVGDNSGIAKAIVKIAETPGMAVKMGGESRTRFLEHFTAPIMIENIVRLYQSLKAK